MSGCSGTTPDHIEDIVVSLKMIRFAHPGIAHALKQPEESDYEPVPEDERSTLAASLSRGKWIVNSELAPPADRDPSKVL